MNFIIYNSQGKIIRTGAAPDDQVFNQAGVGENFSEGTADDSKQYVQNGTLQDMPTAPTKFHAFDYASKTWQDPRSLDQLKAAQWDAIKTSREAAITAPLTTAYGVFDADEASALNITKAVLLAQTLVAMGQPVAINFTLANNTLVTLNAAQMVEVGLTLAAREQQIRTKATDLRVQIEAATTVAQVETIAW